MCSHYVWQLFLFFWVLFFSSENYAKHAVSLAGRQAGHSRRRFSILLLLASASGRCRCTLHIICNKLLLRSKRTNGLTWGEGFLGRDRRGRFWRKLPNAAQNAAARCRCCKTEWSEMVPNCWRWNASWRRLSLVVPCSIRACLSVGTDDRFGWICCSVKQTDADCVAN